MSTLECYQSTSRRDFTKYRFSIEAAKDHDII